MLIQLKSSQQEPTSTSSGVHAKTKQNKTGPGTFTGSPTLADSWLLVWCVWALRLSPITLLRKIILANSIHNLMLSVTAQGSWNYVSWNEHWLVNQKLCLPAPSLLATIVQFNACFMADVASSHLSVRLCRVPITCGKQSYSTPPEQFIET